MRNDEGERAHLDESSMMLQMPMTRRATHKSEVDAQPHTFKLEEK